MAKKCDKDPLTSLATGTRFFLNKHKQKAYSGGQLLYRRVTEVLLLRDGYFPIGRAKMTSNNVSGAYRLCRHLDCQLV